MTSHSFVGRIGQLANLNGHLDWVRQGGRDQIGRAIVLRGRRRVGKSRLVEVFVEQTDVATLFFTATKNAAVEASITELFSVAVQESTLPNRDELAGVTATDWSTALRLLAQTLPNDQPSILVFDEVAWLAGADQSFEGALQAAWDRYLSKKPVLFILIGSDLSMMEALTTYCRPFYQRAVEMILDPLNPAEVADMCGLESASAIDAYLITGGLPLVCQEWPQGASPERFLRHCLADPTSPLIVSGERILAAEFPSEIRARRVLEAIGGGGQSSFTNIARAAGTGDAPLNQGTLNVALEILRSKRLVAVDDPLAEKANRTARRYHVEDSYLRFWLAFVQGALPAVERGRPDIALALWAREWPAWRGRAVEPLVRSALERLLPDSQFPSANLVGGWWPRNNNPEIDLVAADRRPARHIAFVGSIKWREHSPFDRNDLSTLARDATATPGVDAATPLVAVSRSGFDTTDLAATWGPSELLEAWRIG